MKKTLLSLALCLTCSAAFAQVLDVASVNSRPLITFLTIGIQ